MSTEQPVADAAGRTTVGRVVSNKMQKSVTVSVERLVRHPVYGKFIRRTTTIMAHDEDNACREGDTVAIAECRPISKRKAWRVVEIIARGEAEARTAVEAAPEARMAEASAEPEAAEPAASPEQSEPQAGL